MYELKYAEKRDLGMKRQVNQDFVASFVPGDPLDLERSGRLFILADGVGGASDGEKASQFAAQKVLSEYYRYPELPPADRLGRLLQQAGNELYDHAEQSGSYKRMATTMVAAVVLDNRLTVANVGDSRAYLIRNRQITQITNDHNLVGEMMRRGEISEEEAKYSRVKNRLTRSLGGERNVRVDLFEDILLQPGDRIFLCSDGLTRYGSNEQILELAADGQPEEVVDRAIQFANHHGGADNVSATLIEVEPSAVAGGAAFPEDLLETETSTSARVSRGRRRSRGFGDLLASGPAGYLLLAAAAFGVLAAIVLAGMGVQRLLPQQGNVSVTPTIQDQPVLASYLTETQAALSLLSVPTDTLQPTETMTTTASPTITETLQPLSNSPYYVCEGRLQSRIRPEDQAAVSTAAREGLKVYENASTASSEIESLSPGDLLKVISGPECLEDEVWWEVGPLDENGQSGWVQESKAGVFWLIPDSMVCVYEAGKGELDSLSSILNLFSLRFVDGREYFQYPPEACEGSEGRFSCDEDQRVGVEPPYRLDFGWWIVLFGVPEDQCTINGGEWFTPPTVD